MTFRLTAILYLFTLVGVSLAAFGAAGIVVTVFVLGAWAVLINWRPTRAELVVIGFVILTLIVLLLPAVQGARESARRRQCINNMKQLALSLLLYESAQGSFPPATMVHGKNNDRHSWRIRILPFLEHEMISSQYSFDEAWDGPKNSKLVGPLPHWTHECPSHGHSTEASYFAITGANTAWGDGEPRELADITDGTSNTILLVEAAGRGIHWAEPKDLSFDEAVDLLTSKVPKDGSDGHRIHHGYFYKPSYVRNVAMCDGSCHALRVPLEREAAVALLTANGGENIEQRWLEHHTNPVIDYGRVWGFGLFVVVAMLPGVRQLRPWVWPMQSPHQPLEQPATE